MTHHTLRNVSISLLQRRIDIFCRPIAATALLLALSSASGATEAGSVRPRSVIVRSALGGTIIGYDIDQNGTEGLLSEYIPLNNLYYDVATETFDQSTGKIIKIVKRIRMTYDDFVTLGVVGTSVGLVEKQHANSNGDVTKLTFQTLNPLDNNAITGKWTPPLKKQQYILSVSESQGFPDTAVFAFDNSNFEFQTFVFSSDVANNVSGPVIPLTDSIFGRSNSPVMALNTTTNDAIVAVSAGTPELAIVDLVHSTVSYFTGVGDGQVEGIGVDSADNIACTTTTTDYSVEFYNLAKQTGIVEPIPGAGGELQSGTDVEFDSLHGLFLVLQPTASQGDGSAILEYDTKGIFIKSVNGNSQSRLGGVGRIAFNPNTRTGFIQSSNTELESFAY